MAPLLRGDRRGCVLRQSFLAGPAAPEKLLMGSESSSVPFWIERMVT